MSQQGFVNLLEKYPRVAGNPNKIDAVRKMVNNGMSFETKLSNHRRTR